MLTRASVVLVEEVDRVPVAETVAKVGKATPKVGRDYMVGMEWKEHLGWLVPILATVALFLIFRYGEKLAEEKKIRWTLFVIVCIAFVLAGIVGVLGAIITKEAAVV